MGYLFLDQYSLLHFAVGIVAYFFGVSFALFNLAHVGFEYLENTTNGMYVINRYFAGVWPGGKTHSDSLVNSVGDIVFGACGWLIAYYADYYAIKYGWFN